MSRFINSIHQQIASNRTALALNQIKIALEKFSDQSAISIQERQELTNHLTNFLSRLKFIEGQQTQGIVAGAELGITKNALNTAILEVFSEPNLKNNFQNFWNHMGKFVLTEDEEDFWLSICKTNSTQGYSNYLQAFPQGNFSAHANALLQTIESRNSLEILFPGAILYGQIRDYLINPIIQDKSNAVIEQEVLQKYLANDTNMKLIFFSGGSFALFFQTPKQCPSTLTALKTFVFGIYIQSIAQQNDFKIGISLDWEHQPKRAIINHYDFLVTKSVDTAKLHMSFSTKEHFFISKHLFDSFLNGRFDASGKSARPGDSLLTFLRRYISDLDLEKEKGLKRIFHDLDQLYSTIAPLESNDLRYGFPEFKYFDRLKKSFDLYNFHATDRKITIGKEDVPNHWIFIDSRDNAGINAKQKFVAKLINSDKVYILAITHENTQTFLSHALEARGNKPWQELKIIFPSRQIVELISDERDTPNRLNIWEGTRRSLLLFLIDHFQMASNRESPWELLEYDHNLPFVGNLLIGQSGVIRISPILPGKSAKYVYYTEILDGTLAYEQVEEAFYKICEMSLPINEHIVYGKLEGEQLLFSGIIRRTEFDEFIEQTAEVNFSFPVVLIMLHHLKHGVRYSVLQQRTELNASGDKGKYSNISGRIIDFDIINAAQDLALLQQYKNMIIELMRKSAELEEADVLKIFTDLGVLNEGKYVPEDTWKQAAIREIKEELGLDISPARLVSHRSEPLPRKGHTLYFKIFSLDINSEELTSIGRQRPDSALGKFTLDQLEELHDSERLNKLLQKRFPDIFKPIFEDLGIWKKK